MYGNSTRSHSTVIYDSLNKPREEYSKHPIIIDRKTNTTKVVDLEKYNVQHSATNHGKILEIPIKIQSNTRKYHIIK